MTLGAKIYVYEMDNAWYSVLSQLENFNGTTDGIFDGSYHLTINVPFSLTDLSTLDATYGLIFRRIYIIQNGQISSGVISGYGDGAIITWGLWTPFAPAAGSARYYIPIGITANPFNFITTLDVSDAIIKQDLSVTLQLESDKVFDLRESYGTVSLWITDAIRNLMDTYWLPADLSDTRYIFGIEILRDNQPDFWAVAPADSIEENIPMNTITFNCFGWWKFIHDTIGMSPCPYLDTANLSTFLNKLNYWGSINIDVKLADTGFNQSEYLAATFAQNSTHSVQTELNISRFVEELQKHYAAFIYYDKNKRLNFYNRLVSTTEHGGINNDITPYIVRGTWTKTYRPKYYNKLLITAYGDWWFNNLEWLQYKGWALIWMDNGVLQVRTDLTDADIMDEANYLDLRQKFYQEPTYIPTILPSRTRTEVLYDYYELLVGKTFYTCTVYGLDYDIFDTVWYQGYKYSVRKVVKNYNSETSELLLLL